MKVDIFIEIEDNRVKFNLSLPIDFIDRNEDEYNNLDGKTIYVSDNLNVDYIELNKNIVEKVEEIKTKFSIDELKSDKKNINFFIDDRNNENIYEFIKKCPYLNISLFASNPQNLINNLGSDNYPNLKIKFKNSSEELSYDEFYKMNNKLTEIVDFVNHYNLSPLEKILLVYDIVKANEYKKENNDEDYSISRDLNQIINGDKIVCVGFANLMDYLLTNLGIESNCIILEYKDKNVGHQRNYVHLKDDKYNIDGIFFLDATWDSKRDENYLDNYNFFLKPLNFFKNIRKNEIVISPQYFELLQKDKLTIIEYIKNLENDELIKFSLSLSALVNKYSDSKQGFTTFYTKTKEELLQIIEEIYSKYNKTIPLDTFKNSLYKIRKVEYINNIIKFIPDEKYIDSVCYKYYKETPEIKLLKILDLYDEPTLDKDLEESKATTVEEDLLRIRFLKTIKAKIQDIPQNDYIKKM